MHHRLGELVEQAEAEEVDVAPVRADDGGREREAGDRRAAGTLVAPESTVDGFFASYS